jgi:predicted  nucleic acid-binding Zn-ribbon protein
VKQIIQALLDLQNVDQNLTDLRARIAAVPHAIAEVEATVAAARAEFAASKAAQLEAFKARKKYELDVESWKEKAKRYKDQSYQVKTNEAFKALQHEVQNAEDEVSHAEDRLLEEMVASEEYDRRIKASDKLVKEAEEGARVKRAAIEADQAVRLQALAVQEAERARVIAVIPEDLLDHYERIAKKHGGIAVAEVRGEICGACGVRIRPHVFQELSRPGTEELIHCETCTRVLYYGDPSPVAPGPIGHKPAGPKADSIAPAASNEP